MPTTVPHHRTRQPLGAWWKWLGGLCLAWATAVQAADTVVISSISTTPSPLVSALVLKEAYASIGQKFVIRLYPAERALVEANNGSADASLHRSERVEEKFPNLVRIPVPINTVDVITVIKNSKLNGIASWENLRPYRIGVVRGIVLYEKRTAGMNVTKVQYDEELLAMVANDRIDAAVFDRSDALRFLRRPEYRELRITDTSLELRPLFHYVNRKHATLIPRLQKALEKMARSGRIEAIRQEVLAIQKRGGRLPPFPMVDNPQEEKSR